MTLYFDLCARVASALAQEGGAANGGAPAGDPAATAPQGGLPGGFLLMIGVMFLVFYLLVIRPESRRQKTRDAKVKSAKKGDTVVTSGGIIGKIHRVEDKEVVLQVDNNTRLRFLKTAISDVVTSGKGEGKAIGDKSTGDGADGEERATEATSQEATTK